jgi:type IV pilus assembly protein PilV
MRTNISSEHGFSMIEVMVTIVVVAFGLLGLASLVLRGLQAGADSQFRTLAIKQTYDMADRMRGNPVDAKADKYDGILPSGSPSCSSLLSTIQGGGIPVVTTSSTTPPACSGTGVAFDRDCWQRANMTELPKGAGAVCKGAGANWYAVIVSWDENRSGTANKSFWITFEP